jgi:hypothetical protein
MLSLHRTLHAQSRSAQPEVHNENPCHIALAFCSTSYRCCHLLPPSLLTPPVACITLCVRALGSPVTFSAPEWDVGRAYDIAHSLGFVEAHALSAKYD